jgi:hypothetical protein
MKKVIDWFKHFWFIWFFLLLFYVILRVSGYDFKIVERDDYVIDSNSNNTSTPTDAATSVTPTTEPLPAPPTDPNLASEEITSTEVDTFIDTHLVELKSLIVKPYTVNSDKTVTLYLSGQTEPIAILFKVGGKITIKNSN